MTRMSRDAGTGRSLVHLFTDGACEGNPGPGGWAYILRHPETGKESEQSGSERKTTNNRMELRAVIEGLSMLRRPSRVELFSDSQYVVNGLNEWLDGWIEKDFRRGRSGEVKNIDLWETLDGLRQLHRIRSNWVRGHSNHPENERCDRLAVAAIEEMRRA